MTTSLIALAAVGYAVIAFNWYFQSKLHRIESVAATRRLRNIALACTVFGGVFYFADLSWAAWRVYDFVLLLLVCHTWSFAVRMHGLSLVDQRLEQVEELERTAQRYREIAELLPNVVWTARSDGRVDFSNRRWSEFAGGTRSWTDAVHPEEQAEVELWWRRAVRGREPVAREIRLFGSDGEYRTFAVRATPVVRGDAVRWLGACADVEDQKRAVVEREEQARQKVFFLNALSHDLRAPLHNVTLNAHLLKMAARDDSEVLVINTIVENAVAAGELVTRLLEFARAGEDRSDAERLPAAAAVLRPLVGRFLPLAREKGLYLRLEAPAADADVWVDRQQFERVVCNLVDNAIKFTEHGGITVELVAPPAGQERASGVRVRVSDTGIGIPDVSVAHVFDEFYQVNNHERDRKKGFGIGLAICRSLARQFGGDVRLVRTSAEGSCFEVVVPAAAPPVIVVGGGGTAGASAGGSIAVPALAGAAVGGGGAGIIESGADRPRERVGGGGRPDGSKGHHIDPEAAGLCGV